MSLELHLFLKSRLPRLAFDQESNHQVVAYHGTRQSALQSIIDNGLLAHPFKHYHPSRFYKGERGDSVYVTESKQEAQNWALSAVDDPDQAILLELCVPQEKLKPDEEREGAERFVGNIPPEWIRHVYPIQSNGGLGKAIPLGPGHEDGEVRFAAVSTTAPTEDAEFKESNVKRDAGGKFASSGGGGKQEYKGVGSDNPTYKKHLEEGHALAIKHGWEPLRGLDDADMGQSKGQKDGPGPFLIYEKGKGENRELLRFYTKHDWNPDPKPLWYVQRGRGERDAGGDYHEGLEEFFAKEGKVKGWSGAKDIAMDSRPALKQFMARQIVKQLNIAADSRRGWYSPTFGLAMDYGEGTFSEEDHPRDNSGKFAKKGTASPKLIKQLKAAGYEKHPDFPDSEVYQHKETGHHIAFNPPSIWGGKIQPSTAIKHLPPPSKGKASKLIYGGKGLTELLNKLHSGQAAGGGEHKFKELKDEFSNTLSNGKTSGALTTFSLPDGSKLNIQAPDGPVAFWSIVDSDGDIQDNGYSLNNLKETLQYWENPGSGAPQEQSDNEKAFNKLTGDYPFLGEPIIAKNGNTATYDLPGGGLLKVDMYPVGGGIETWHTETEQGTITGEGYSNSGLVQHLDSIQGVSAEGHVAPPGHFDLEKQYESGNILYKDTNGNEIKTAPDGGWTIYNEGDSAYLSKGKGQEELNAKLADLGWSGSGQSKDPDAALAAAVPGMKMPKSGIGSVGEAIDVSKLKKISEKKGSNPGGVFEDPDTGKQYYVKTPQSVDHARNELLAAKLYQLAGAPTLNYHDNVADGKVVTEMANLGASNIDQLTSAQKAKARLDFATHAWLANWDATGLSNDNIGADENGDHINLDVGGSLAYRAQGGEKGNLFGNSVGEWDSLRDKNGKNPKAAAFFGDMSKEDLVISASAVAQVTDAQIAKAIMDAGYPDDKGSELHDKLVKRRDDVIARSKAEFNAKKATAPTSSGGSTAASSPAAPAAPKNKDPTDAKHEFAKGNPPRSNAVSHAITDYKGSGYHTMNPCARFLDDCDDDRVVALDEYMAKTKLSAGRVWRGIPYDETYIAKIIPLLKPGVKLPDEGFMSTSTSESFSNGWRRNKKGLLFEIEVSEGAHGTVVRPTGPDNEYEVLMHRGSRLVVTKFDKVNNKVWATLDQSKVHK
jgi:hypothetical protein